MNASVFARIPIGSVPPTTEDLTARTRFNVATATHLKDRIERVGIAGKRSWRDWQRFRGDAGDPCTSAGP